MYSMCQGSHRWRIGSFVEKVPVGSFSHERVHTGGFGTNGPRIDGLMRDALFVRVVGLSRPYTLQGTGPVFSHQYLPPPFHT